MWVLRNTKLRVLRLKRPTRAAPRGAFGAVRAARIKADCAIAQHPVDHQPPKKKESTQSRRPERRRPVPVHHQPPKKRRGGPERRRPSPEAFKSSGCQPSTLLTLCVSCSLTCTPTADPLEKDTAVPLKKNDQAKSFLLLRYKNLRSWQKIYTMQNYF